MLRYLCVILGVIALSACTEKKDTTTTSSNSTPGNETSNTTTRTSTTTGTSATTTDRGARTDSTLTAGDQSENETDREITQRIRQAVVADSTLSVKAKNATIITVDGVVTLRGSVDTAAERRLVASKADGVSGVRRVDNNLEIAQ